MEIKINLFPNTNKSKDTQPDYRGKTQDGLHEIAGWKKQDKNGNTYLSLVLKDAQQQQAAPSTTTYTAPAPTLQVTDDSHLPF